MPDDDGVIKFADKKSLFERDKAPEVPDKTEAAAKEHVSFSVESHFRSCAW